MPRDKHTGTGGGGEGVTTIKVHGGLLFRKHTFLGLGWRAASGWNGLTFTQYNLNQQIIQTHYGSYLLSMEEYSVTHQCRKCISHHCFLCCTWNSAPCLLYTQPDYMTFHLWALKMYIQLCQVSRVPFFFLHTAQVDYSWDWYPEAYFLTSYNKQGGHNIHIGVMLSSW